MPLFGSTYKRLLLVIFLALSALASAMAQGGIVVTVGETRTYQVEKHTGSSYGWVIYNDPTFQTAALNSEARIVTGENTSSLEVNWLKSGTYYPLVVETDQTGCTNTKAIIIVVNEGNILWPVIRITNPMVLIGNSKYILSGSCQSITLDASASSGEGLTYHWEPSINLDNPASPTPVFSPGTTTNYVLTVTDINGHSSSESVGVMVTPKVIADAGENVIIRVNQSGMLDGSKSSGENLDYLWRTENGHIIEGSTSGHPVVDQPGKYYLTVTDQFGCFESDSVMVNWYIQAVRDTAETELNFSVDINVLANDIPNKSLNPSTLRILNPPKNGIAMIVGDSVISYSPNQYFVGSDTFVYSICDYFKNCDQATVLVYINDIPFFIPEAFSPNGDGINDKFEIKGLAKYKSVEIEIFNRWGNVVFQSSKYGEENGMAGFWDGMSSSKMGMGQGPVPTGTYFYILKMNGKQNMTGAIFLDR